MNPIDAYALEVIAGRVPAGKYHRLACVRHMTDRGREQTPGFPYRFDAARAKRFVDFAQKLKHYKGEWAGTPIMLQPYQVFRLGCIFGWIHAETGLRRFRQAYNEIPRKNGKTLEAAIVLLYLTFFDGEQGAEGYTIATKRDQAKLVFNDAKKLVESSGLKTRITVRVANLHRDESSSKAEPLGADHDSTDGLNPHVYVVDEMHAYKDRGLIDVMETATGARRNPLGFKITTAGDNHISPCGDEHDYACKILDGTLVDENYFAFIASADPTDDWTDERTWQKANPNWNVSIKPDDLRALCTKAKGIPSAAATFKQKRLNLWVNATAPCLSVDGWRKGQSSWSLEEMRGEPCYVGIDLSTKIDLCAASAVFPPRPGRQVWRVYQRIWTPKDTLLERAHADRAPYPVWVDQGWLEAPDGTSIDHGVVRQFLTELRGLVDIEQIGFDPWHAGTLIHDLVKIDGFDERQVLEVPQTFAGLANAEGTFKALVLAGDVDARGCPVTAWAVSNVVEQVDGKGNIQFTKKKSRGRIDPVKSITNAMSLALRHVQRQASAQLSEWI